MALRGLREENQLFAAALVVSLLVHIAAFIHWQLISTRGVETHPMSEPSPIAVVLMRQASPPVRSVAERQVRSREVIKPQQQLQPVEAPVAPVNESPISESENSPISENLSEGETTLASEPVVKEQGVADAALRDRYLAALLAHIESHKFYPLPARRRGIEGSVAVSFTLDAQGKISDLDVSGGNSLFVKAARAAVDAALPLPKAPSLEGFPLAVRFQMIFKLQ